MPDDNSFGPDFIEWLVDVATSESTDVDDLGREELADLWQRCDALGSIVSTAIAKVQDRLAPLLKDAPVMLSDGTVLRHKPTPSRTQWKNEQLLEEIFERATRHVIDPDSGQRVALVDPKLVRGLLKPSTALTKLQALGINYRDYCIEQWTEKVEAQR